MLTFSFTWMTANLCSAAARLEKGQKIHCNFYNIQYKEVKYKNTSLHYKEQVKN